MADQAQVRDKVAELLTIKAEGEPLAAGDGQTIDEDIVSVHARLTRERVITWPLTAVPDDSFLSFAQMVAANTAPAFEKWNNKIESDGLRGEVNLRAMTQMAADEAAEAAGTADDPIPALYY